MGRTNYRNGFAKTFQVSKGAKIRKRYNQIPHLTQDTNGKVINSQLDTTNESQEVNMSRMHHYNSEFRKKKKILAE